MKKFLILFTLGIAIFILSGTGFSAETYEFRPNDGYGQLYDLRDLDHSYAYSWEIDLGANVIDGESIDVSKISGAQLIFTDMYNWDDNYNILHVSALNPNDTVGNDTPTWSYTDNTGNNQGTVTEYWDGNDTGSTNYFSDANGFTGAEMLFQIENLDKVDREDNNPLTVTLNEDTIYKETIIDNVDYAGSTTLKMQADTLGTLTGYIANNILTLAFDADCHFYNDGIKLVLTTTSTPTSLVPEPGSLLLFGFGLIGVGAVGRRRLNIDKKNMT